MPKKLAPLFALFKASPGQLDRRSGIVVVWIAAILLGAATAVFLRVTWNQELNEEVIVITALFVATALVMVGYARRVSKEDDDASGK